MEKRFTRNNVGNVVSPCVIGFVIAGTWFPFALIPGAILLGDGLLGTTYFDFAAVIEESKACEIFEKVVIIKKKSKIKAVVKAFYKLAPFPFAFIEIIWKLKIVLP
ncbi:hypothetical protein F8M41_017517 [Gigaspora margarita]|uniref:Uncharacterized protein n=1 Tax=Gigaspora margarita TaxID=4874 RepID=A0A8H3WWL5_GIGMA|nr:hypothetical protein F8M41_017517 [Gigaspora margarita]